METFRILMGASLELKKAQNCMQNRMTGWKNVIKFYGDAAFITSTCFFAASWRIMFAKAQNGTFFV